MKHQPRYAQNQPSDPDKARQTTAASGDLRVELLAKLASLGVVPPKGHLWRIPHMHFLLQTVQKQRAEHSPCDECNTLRLQLRDARDRLDAIHRTLSNLDTLTRINQPLHRFPAVGTPASVQADYANRLIALGEITGKPMSDLLDNCRDLVRDYRLSDAPALRAVEGMHGYTWAEGRYVPYEQ